MRAPLHQHQHPFALSSNPKHLSPRARAAQPVFLWKGLAAYRMNLPRTSAGASSPGGASASSMSSVSPKGREDERRAELMTEEAIRTGQMPLQSEGSENKDPSPTLPASNLSVSPRKWPGRSKNRWADEEEDENDDNHEGDAESKPRPNVRAVQRRRRVSHNLM